MLQGYCSITILLLWTSAWLSAQTAAPRSPTPEPVPAPVRVETIVEGLEHPWGLAFLPDGDMVITERPGRIRIADRDGHLSEPLSGLPEISAAGQGGLLDVALDPGFAENRLLYFSYTATAGTETAAGGLMGTNVARVRLGQNSLDDLEVIYRQDPKGFGSDNFGSRLVFAPDGTLFLTLGDRYHHRLGAQDLSTGFGKIIRIHPGGNTPSDNPFVKTPEAQPEIWSYGHRNIQGAAIDPETGQLWTVEHGARGGDELNHPEAGMEQPVYYWDPVIAPSGMVFYTGDAFPEWKGSLFIGSLAPGLLVRLTMQDGIVVKEDLYLAGLKERIRSVVQGPDDDLYLVTDSPEGRVIRLIHFIQDPRRLPASSR